MSHRRRTLEDRERIVATNISIAASFERREQNRDPAIKRAVAAWPEERRVADREAKTAKRLGLDRAGYEENRKVTTRIGQNPYNGASDVLTSNAGHDVLEYLIAHRKITEPEKAAGDHFRRLCEIADSAGSSSNDYGRPPSNPGPRTMVTDAMLRAKDELERIERKLGERGFAMLVRVIHHGVSISDMARLADDIDLSEGMSA